MQYLQSKKYSFLENKFLQLSLLYLLSFLIPFLLKGPQIIIGTSINFLLILAISQFKFKEILPALILPSISVYIHGLLFGQITNFLLLLIPFIAIGNSLYVIVFKRSKFHHMNILLASVLKALFLLTSTYILIRMGHVPEVLLHAMGATQLFTALLGGSIAYILLLKNNYTLSQ